MIPVEIFGLFMMTDVVFIWAGFMHEDTGYWECAVFSAVSTILSFLLALWMFDGVSTDSASYSNGYAAMFLALLALVCLSNFVVRTLDGFGREIDISKMLDRWT